VLSIAVALRIYRRNLPHLLPEHVPVFFTWRLHGSLTTQQVRTASQETEFPGQRFRRVDDLLDRTAIGPRWLRDPRIGSLVCEEIEMGATRFGRYELLEYVVMPNHVHLLILPLRSPAQLMRWLKGTTARRANAILNRTGEPFWQDESFDHWCRDTDEVARIRQYIALNPVRCGLVQRAQDWPWSSAHERLVRKQQKLVQRAPTGKI
jgi:putative transposase